jgi:hypothetical protein
MNELLVKWKRISNGKYIGIYLNELSMKKLLITNNM